MLTFSVPVAENVSDMPCNHMQRILEWTTNCVDLKAVYRTYTEIQCLHDATTNRQQLTMLRVNLKSTLSQASVTGTPLSIP